MTSKQPTNRYIQPQSVHEALGLIQSLFNSYRNEPLTNELLAYHNNLIFRLQSDLKSTAQRDEPDQLAHIDSMTAVMRSWTNAKLTGKPFQGRMKNFKLSTAQPKFKTKVHKIKGRSSHRGTCH